MSTFVEQLVNPTSGDGITSATLWSEVAGAAPLIIGIFIFAFGYRVVKKVLKSGSKGKLNA